VQQDKRANLTIVKTTGYERSAIKHTVKYTHTINARAKPSSKRTLLRVISGQIDKASKELQLSSAKNVETAPETRIGFDPISGEPFTY
jgi:hypothetical protein